MCHNYLGDMYLCIFGEKPAPDTVPSYGYTTKKCLFKQITRPLLFCIDLGPVSYTDNKTFRLLELFYLKYSSTFLGSVHFPISDNIFSMF